MLVEKYSLQPGRCVHLRSSSIPLYGTSTTTVGYDQTVSVRLLVASDRGL